MRSHRIPPPLRGCVPSGVFPDDGSGYHNFIVRVIFWIGARSASKCIRICQGIRDCTVSNEYLNPGPTREEIDASQGSILLEFGTAWCGHCQGAAPIISDALAQFPSVQHIKVEDGPGRPLGRSFRVKLWPTAIFLKDGAEIARAVRPESADEICLCLQQIT
jgi:thioredoxin 1